MMLFTDKEGQMQNLTEKEINSVSGASVEGAGYVIGYAIGSLVKFGSWLGGEIYDVTH